MTVIMVVAILSSIAIARRIFKATSVLKARTRIKIDFTKMPLESFIYFLDYAGCIEDYRRSKGVDYFPDYAVCGSWNLLYDLDFCYSLST